jgi:hypothetical protein
MKRKRGERNWDDQTGDYELHVPTSVIPSDDLEQTMNEHQRIIWVHGTPYIRAADGKLDPID